MLELTRIQTQETAPEHAGMVSWLGTDRCSVMFVYYDLSYLIAS